MTTICPTKVQCDCLDEPIENLSGEGPDNPSFLGIFRPPNKPRLGIPFESRGCVRWCFSEVSQAEADRCAELQAIECQEDEVFYSAEKTCEVICPSGFVLTGTELAGAVVSAISQEDADTRAMSLACRKANLTACSGVVIPVGNESQGVSCIEGTDMTSTVPLPDNLSITGPTLTVEANSFTAETQSAANALAAAYVTDYFNNHIDVDLFCCETAWAVEEAGTNYPPVNGSWSFGTPSAFSYADLSAVWDECQMSEHGDGSSASFGPNGNNTTWAGSVTVRPSQASQWAFTVADLMQINAAATIAPYPAANFVVQFNGAAAISDWVTVVDGFGDTMWISTAADDGNQNSSTWNFNLVAGDELLIQWQFTGVGVLPFGTLQGRGRVALFYMGP